MLFTLQVIWAEQQHEKIRVKRGHFHDRMTARGIVPRFSDPLWDAQWYLVRNYGAYGRLFVRDETKNRVDLTQNCAKIQ